MEMYEASASIRAAGVDVWRLLADVERWPQWLPTVRSVKGLGMHDLQTGARFRVSQPGLPAAVWTVTSVAPSRRFTWQSRSPGLRIVADHILTEQPDGTTSVLLRLSFAGPFGSLVARITSRTARQHLEQEAAALQRALEAGRAAAAGEAGL